jgi:hypothetical protein
MTFSVPAWLLLTVVFYDLIPVVLHSSGGDKRPRTITGKAFRAIDPSQKFLLIDKIIYRRKRIPSCYKKEESC